MKVLVLGGTRFVGRHIVAELLARDDDVTLLYRGHSPSPFIGLARHVLADRRAPNAEARAALAEPWDAVVDTSAHHLDDLAAVTSAIGNVGHFLFLSTCGVYRRQARTKALTEQSPTIASDTSDPTKASATHKLRCERFLRRTLAGRAPLLIVRLGLVVGSYDYSGRFAYWLERAVRGGDVFVPMQPDQPIQLIDVRDVARFVAKAAKQGLSGVVNVVGPKLTAANMIHTVLRPADHTTTATWVDEDFALSHAVHPWTEVPLWLPRTSPERVLMTVSSTHAENNGLTTRQLEDTVDECMSWHQMRRSWSQRWLDSTREQHLILLWRR